MRCGYSVKTATNVSAFENFILAKAIRRKGDEKTNKYKGFDDRFSRAVRFHSDRNIRAAQTGDPAGGDADNDIESSALYRAERSANPRADE
jgi:hypothetical protein